jgi:hypothetical protein
MTQAFDALGPLAREAVAASPIEITVGDMLTAWARANPGMICVNGATQPRNKWPLSDPAVDASVAAFVRDAVKRKMGKPAEAFVLRPIVKRRRLVQT